MGFDSKNKKAATPWWFWVFAGLMVLLNVLGMVQLVDPYLLSEAETEELISPVGLEIMKAEPFWATVGYSLEVIGRFWVQSRCCDIAPVGFLASSSLFRYSAC